MIRNHPYQPLRSSASPCSKALRAISAKSLNSNTIHFAASAPLEKKPSLFSLKPLTKIAILTFTFSQVPQVLREAGEFLYEHSPLNRAEISCLDKPSTPVIDHWKIPKEFIPQVEDTNLTGTNIQGIILEPDDDKHATQVFNSAKTIAPKLNLNFCFFKKDRTGYLNSSAVSKNLSLVINGTSDAIETLIEKKKAKKLPNLRLINMSFSASKKRIYENIRKENKVKKIWGFEKGTMNPNQIIYEVDRRLNASSEVKEALSRYQEITCEAVKNNITIITSSENMKKKWKKAIDPEAGFNMSGMSNCVITAAAYGLMYTITTGKVTESIFGLMPFSSGGSKQWHPTISAYGRYGTSQASPITFATLGLALEKNPTLDFRQQKKLLESTATDTPEPIEAEGAGMLDIIKLLEAVPEEKETS